MAMNHVGSWLDFPDMDDPAAPRQTKNGTVVHFFFFFCVQARGILRFIVEHGRMLFSGGGDIQQPPSSYM